MTSETVRPATWLELLSALEAGSWNESLGRFRSPYAFRGHPTADEDLSSSLMRLAAGRDATQRERSAEYPPHLGRQQGAVFLLLHHRAVQVVHRQDQRLLREPEEHALLEERAQHALGPVHAAQRVAPALLDAFVPVVARLGQSGRRSRRRPRLRNGGSCAGNRARERDPHSWALLYVGQESSASARTVTSMTRSRRAR